MMGQRVHVYFSLNCMLRLTGHEFYPRMACQLAWSDWLRKVRLVGQVDPKNIYCHTTVHCPKYKKRETLLNPWVGGIGDLIWYSLAEQPNLCSILQFDVPQKTLLIHNKWFYSSALIKLGAYIMWGACCYAVCLGKINFKTKNLLKNHIFSFDYKMILKNDFSVLFFDYES